MRKITEEFRRIGGDLFEQRQNIEATLAKAETAFVESSEGLRDFPPVPCRLCLFPIWSIQPRFATNRTERSTRLANFMTYSATAIVP